MFEEKLNKMVITELESVVDGFDFKYIIKTTPERVYIEYYERDVETKEYKEITNSKIEIMTYHARQLCQAIIDQIKINEPYLQD